jgi:hypothetical protein
MRCRDFVLARYNPNGSLDPGFGNGGRMIANLRPLSADTIYGLALQPDGKILAGGVSFPDTVVLQEFQRRLRRSPLRPPRGT